MKKKSTSLNKQNPEEDEPSLHTLRIGSRGLKRAARKVPEGVGVEKETLSLFPVPRPFLFPSPCVPLSNDGKIFQPVIRELTTRTARVGIIQVQGIILDMVAMLVYLTIEANEKSFVRGKPTWPP